MERTGGSENTNKKNKAVKINSTISKSRTTITIKASSLFRYEPKM